jgi:hypothetical protein
MSGMSVYTNHTTAAPMPKNASLTQEVLEVIFIELDSVSEVYGKRTDNTKEALRVKLRKVMF